MLGIKKKALQCFFIFPLPLLNTRISGRMQSQDLFSFFSSVFSIYTSDSGQKDRGVAS